MEEKIPSPREIIDFLNRKEVRIILLWIAVIILIVSAFKLADIQNCKAKEGIYMEGGDCYIPKNEAERQQILEQGFIETGFDADFKRNLSEILGVIVKNES